VLGNGIFLLVVLSLVKTFWYVVQQTFVMIETNVNILESTSFKNKHWN